MRRCARHPDYVMRGCLYEMTAPMLHSLIAECHEPRLADKVFDVRQNFVQSELADIAVRIANVAYPSYNKNKDISAQALLEHKRKAVESLIQSISPNLMEETRAELANRMLNEIW